MHNPDAKLDPTALALPDAVRLLTAVGQSGVTVEMLEADIAAGAPTNVNGTINLVTYTAWMLLEASRAERSA
jgi:hypothetical protein